MSVIVFDPVTTVAAVMDAGGPIGDLIAQALPMTTVFICVAAGLVTLAFGGSWSDFGATLVTTAVLMLFLGLNISTLGLVAFPSGSMYLVCEVFGLVLAIDMVYASVFAGLEWRSLAAP
jgi:hypothetical protein